MKAKILTAGKVVALTFAMCFLFLACKTRGIDEGDAALKRGEYFEAQKIFRQVYNNTSAQKNREIKGEMAFKMGLCYEKLNMTARASAAFKNAIRYQWPDSTVYLNLGKSLMAEGNYKDAIEAFTTFLNFRPGSQYALQAIEGCKQAIASRDKKSSRYVVKNMKTFNSHRSDFSPMFYGRNFDQIYFTSTSDKALGEKKSGVTGMKGGDIYVSKKDEKGEWQYPVPLEGSINTDADEGIVSFSPDGKTMYFTVATAVQDNSDSLVEIFYSQRSDATWGEPEKVEIEFANSYSVGQPAVSSDGRTLYFVSDMPGGYGGLDIWRISLPYSGSKPVNMGPEINTPGNEMFPYSRSDSLFYFSSDGHPGYGGLDIFKVRFNSLGDVVSLENMDKPINSEGDDFGITFADGEYGFISSNRGDARGYDHIYSFELPDLRTFISGYVFDREEEPVVGAVIRIVGDDGSNQKEVARDDGSFRFRLDRGVRYVMKAGAPGYLNVKQEFTSEDDEEDADYEIDFRLTALNRPQVLENIFYDFDKAELRNESKEALEELVSLLKENPNIAIEMASHTDRKGSDEYNKSLSEKRAKSVVDYLISRGIEASRLTHVGYGKSHPKKVTKRIAKEYPQFMEGVILSEEYIDTLEEKDKEDADQINRRTEFTVVSVEFELL